MEEALGGMTGTPGYKAYRHRGRYIFEYHEYDSYPEGLGLDILSAIPTDPELFREWLRAIRQYLDQLLVEYQDELDEYGSFRDDDGDFNISRVQPQNEFFIAWVYIIDLDRLIFHVDGVPMYRLDHMPEEPMFLKGISYNIYGHRACDVDVPAEHRFNLDVLPTPPVEASTLEKYRDFVQSGTPFSVHDLLSLSTVPSVGEVIIEERTVYLHLCLTTWKEVPELAFLLDSNVLWPSHRRLAFQLAALALVHMSHIFRESINLEYDIDIYQMREVRPFSGPEARVWWPRRHICVLIAAHLVHEDNCKAAIVQAVEEIMKGDGLPEIVYGVVFSVFHCVLVRVDRKDGGRFAHTDVLPYCPDIFTSGPVEWTTTGLDAMVRLGNLAADDDEDYFCHLLRLSWTSRKYAVDECSSSHDISNEVGLTGERYLPQEMINYIAEFIDDSRTLSAFALASRSTMAAAIPRLRLPNLLLPEANTGIILESSLAVHEFGGQLVDAIFDAQYEDTPIRVRIQLSGFAQGYSLDIPFIFESSWETLIPCTVRYEVLPDEE